MMDYIYLINLSTQNSLTQIFKCSSWQNLREQAPKLFKWFNFQKLDPALNNIIIKQNSLGCRVLNTWSELGYESSSRYQSTWILLVNRKNHRCINNRHKKWLTKRSRNVVNWKQLPETVSHSYYLCLHIRERIFCL